MRWIIGTGLAAVLVAAGSLGLARLPLPHPPPPPPACGAHPLLAEFAAELHRHAADPTLGAPAVQRWTLEHFAPDLLGPPCNAGHP